MKSLVIFLCTWSTFARGQVGPELSLQECRRMATEKYPVTRQKLLIKQVTDLH